MNKYLVEFIGTFFLAFTVGMCVLKPDVGNFTPIAVGAVLMVMIYAGGHISGGHYNPAVTIAVWLRGKCTGSDVPGYIVAQVLAAVAAAFAVLYFKDAAQVAPQPLKIAPSLLVELLGTFALCWVVLNTATSKDTAGNSNYGLAIGFTVTAMAYAVGGISGGAFNPAVAIGVGIMNIVKGANIWIHLVADLGGGVLAAFLFKALSLADRQD